MKRGIYLTLVLGLALTCFGCSAETKTATSAVTTGAAEASTNPTETPAVTGEFTLVSLKVPNMT